MCFQTVFKKRAKLKLTDDEPMKYYNEYQMPDVTVDPDGSIHFGFSSFFTDPDEQEAALDSAEKHQTVVRHAHGEMKECYVKLNDFTKLDGFKEVKPGIWKCPKSGNSANKGTKRVKLVGEALNIPVGRKRKQATKSKKGRKSEAEKLLEAQAEMMDIQPRSYRRYANI